MKEIKLGNFDALMPSTFSRGGGRSAFSKLAASLILFVFVFNLVSPHIASATIYQPGETLTPDCAPGSANCGVATYPSSLGTTTPIRNSLLTIEATSTGSILATLRAFAGQVANLFQIQNSNGVNLFSISASGGLTLGSLNGPLQANAGLVSATTSIGVLYGGTGLTSAPSYGQLLVGNSLGGYTLTATSSLGLGGSSGTVTSVALTAPTGLTVTGSPITTGGTLALSLTSGYIIPLSASSTEYDSAYANRITSASSPLSITNHVISLSTAGDWTGTLDGQEGSYFLNANNLSNFGTPFYTFFSATTTDALLQGATNKYYSTNLFAGSLAGTTTTALAEGTNLYFTNNRVASVIVGTTTDALAQGSTNRYYADSLVGAHISSSSTVPHIGGSAFGDTLSWTGSAWTKRATSTLGIALSDTTGTLAATGGGTGLTSLTPGDIIYANGANSFARVASSTGGKILQLDFTTGAPSWVATSTLGLSSGSGTVTSVNASGGSTGLSFSGGPVTTSGTITLAGILNTANGGTGWANVASGALIYGNGSSALATTSAGTAGNVLALLNGAPTWTASTTFSGGLTYLNGNVTNTGVISLAGTANQITASGSTGAVTLSLPSLLSIINASSTQQSIFDRLYVGGSATSTILGSATSTFGAGIQGTYLNLTGGVASSTFAGGLIINGGGLRISTLDCSASNRLLQTDSSGNIICGDDDTSAGAGVSTIQENDVSVESSASIIDFLGTDFVITSSPAGEANVSIDYSNSGITRLGQNEVITGAWRFNQASSTLFSNVGTAYFGGTATSTFSSTGALTLASALGVGSGGTGATSFGQGWVFSSGDGNALSASTSPTVNYVTATSTTATSTFAYGINITGGCFAKNGACIGITSDLQTATSFLATDVSLSTSATSTLTTVSVTPSAATGDVFIQAEVSIRSASNTDGSAVIAIRRTNCTGTILAELTEVITEANAVGSSAIFLTYVDVDAGASSQTYALCGSAVTQGHTVTTYSLSATVIDTGADLAEIYTTNDAGLEVGDVVSYDFALKAGIKKSANAYDQNVLGIVSTRPAMVIGGVDKEGVKALPVALSGRVPVKIVTENGSIEPGDYLTPSSLPGIAMKTNRLGPVIGQAMSAYNGEGVGMILALVKNFDLGAIEQVAVLMGDISPKVTPDGSDNGLSTLVATIQSETAHDPVVIIAKKITDGVQFLTDFVAARVTAIKGYFDELFANKTHQKTLCVGDAENGGETCVTKTEFDALLEEANIHAAATSTGTSMGDTSIGDSATSTSSADSSTTSTATETAKDTPLTAPEATAPVVSEPAPTPVPEAVIIPEPQREPDPPPAFVETSVGTPVVEPLASPTFQPSLDAMENTATEKHYRH